MGRGTTVQNMDRVGHFGSTHSTNRHGLKSLVQPLNRFDDQAHMSLEEQARQVKVHRRTGVSGEGQSLPLETEVEFP